MAKLPDQFEKKDLVKYMQIGESAYVTPWSMVVDSTGECKLNTAATFHSRPGGTVSLKVKRVNNGFIAFLFDMKDDYTWEKGDGCGYSHSGYEPVIGFGESIVSNLKNSLFGKNDTTI